MIKSIDKITVALNEMDLNFIKMLADERKRTNLEAGSDRKAYGNSNADQNELMGMASEWIVAKALNCMPDTSTYVRSGTSDIILKDGRLADVKWTKHTKRGHLQTKRRKELDYSDVYILVVGTNLENLTIVGYATKGELISKDNFYNLSKYDNAPTYNLKQKKLHPIAELNVYERIIDDIRS